MTWQTQPVQTHREDDGDTYVIFGAGATVADLGEALAALPQDAVLGDLETRYFSEAEGAECKGQSQPDAAHTIFIATIGVYPEELDEVVKVPDTIEELAP